MKEVKKETTSMKQKIKKVVMSLMALALVAVVAVLGTLAYLSALSDKVTNTFTATKNIKLDLIEPDFDEELAKNYQPGVTYNKNPQLVNCSEKPGDKEWVIMRVDYIIGKNKTAYSDVKTKLADIITKGDDLADINEKDGFEDNWIKVTESMLRDGNSSGTDDQKSLADIKTKFTNNTTSEFYIYKYPLVAQADNTRSDITNNTYGDYTSAVTATNNVPGSKTTPLFTNVKIKEQTVLMENYKKTDGEKEVVDPPAFKIYVQGGAIKDLKLVNSSNDPITVLDTDALTKEQTGETYTIVEALVNLLIDKDPTVESTGS